MKQRTEERCSEKPQELQLIASDTYIERKNIKEVKHPADETAGTEAYTEWVCESREIGVSEYEMLKSIEAIDTTKAIDAYTLQLIEEGLL